MTDLVVVQEQLLDPLIGELHPGTPDAAGRLLTRLRSFYAPLRAAISNCERVLVEESQRQGTKTVRVGDATYEIYGGVEVDYDVGFLREGLEDAGCPDGRIEELIKPTVTYRVDQRVAKQLAASNPLYGDIIDAAKTVVARPPKVRVKS